ncbi:thioredoxin domain-containing protein, partial [Patescibacteria group bacterium]|nr:thioredoxin domain-containing protein [Patescibacteria group bacterium]
AITALSWGQKYIDDIVRHPVGIYMSLNGLAMFIFLWLLRKKIKTEGALFLIFILWYSGTRFLLDNLRCADLDICDSRYFGLTLSQYISILLFFLAIAILIFKYRKQKFMSEQEKSAVSNSQVVPETGGRQVFKKYWACAIIFLIGLTIGLGVSSAYYERLFKQPIFSFRAKTWVYYEEPIVGLTMVTDKNCVRCNISDVIKQLKTVIPTLVVKEMDFKSDAGKGLLSEFKIKSLPALVFGPEVEKAAIFEKISQALQKENGKYYVIPLNSGIVQGKFLEPPEVSGSDRVKGTDSAQITVFEFSDFQCPYCKAAKETISQVLAAYPDKVKLVYKHLPLAIHPDAQYAAEAAECAGDQGKFWEMRDKLFANQNKLDKDSIAKYGRELKLDNKKFSDCLFTHKFKAKIDADTKAAAGFEITSTPAFIVGDEFISGAAPSDDFKAVIENQLKNK